MSSTVVSNLVSSPRAQAAAYRTCEQEAAGSTPALPIFFPRIDDSHCDRIHSSLVAAHGFDNGYFGIQSVT